MNRCGPALLAVCCLFVPTDGSADTADLAASRDNTLYEDGAGGTSNGSGEHFFAGLNNSGNIRRGLLAFDVAASIPAGSTINSVTLTLFMSRTTAGTRSVDVHRVLDDWGEGASNAGGEEGGGTTAEAGDATWIHRFFNSDFWTNAGGDFTGIVSATTLVGGDGFYSWSSATLAGDVQDWIDTPANNFGWILLGDEGAGGSTSKRFDSRSNGVTSRRPVLTVDFTPPFGACCNGSSCSLGTEDDCDASGGTFQGIGGNCISNPCLLPTGACCYADGSCAELANVSCNLTGGLFRGDGTICLPRTCPEPTGACCADSGACTQETELACSALGATFQGSGSDCMFSECPVILEPFVDALPIPPVAQPVFGDVGGQAAYEIAAEQFQQQLHRDLPPTTLWGYNGQYPGPTIEAASNETVTVTWENDLRDSMGALRTDHLLPVDLCLHGPNFEGPTARTVVHLHGAHVEAAFDGYPEDTILPGEDQVYVYGNDQLPATLWYHDHALGITRLNMYLGLAGFYLIRDPFEQSLGLPSGEYEIPLIIQDRTFNPDGSLSYPTDWQEHFFGDTILVNGKVWPYLDVKQGKYRFRILNGSGSRTLTLELSPGGIDFEQIGSDGGLLPFSVPVSQITLGPAERADVILDFAGLSAGTEILLTNSAAAPFPGNPGIGVVPNVMKFVVQADAGDIDPIPPSLRPIELLQEDDSVATRDFELFLTSDPCTGIAWSINGLRWDDITEYPNLGTTEIWRFINRSGLMHPMHMHLVMFQVLDRQAFQLVGGVPTPFGMVLPPPAEEAGWKDTVQARPGEITRVIARFEDYKGKFAYHCHIVEHEDNEMMRQFEAIDCGDGELDPTEECDDGNSYSKDGCSSSCTPEEYLELTGLAQGGVVQIVVDGITFYGFTSSGQSAAQVVQGLTNEINSNATLNSRGVTATAIGGRLVIGNGSLSVTNISDPGLSTRLSLNVGPVSLWWARVQGASSCDVVRGDLISLAGSGDFAASTEACAADDETASSLITTDPPPGQGTWYLVRAGSGSYDTGEPSQSGSRDAGIAGSGNGCP